MKILKKLTISIVIIMIIISSILPSSSYAAFTPKQKTQLTGFVNGYVKDYGNTGEKYKSGYDQNKRTDIFMFDYKNNSIKNGHENIYSDCSSFVSFVYWTISDGNVNTYNGGYPWDTTKFKENAYKKDDDKNKYFYKVDEGAQLEVGDILWWQDPNDRNHRHVMLYMGNNRVVHSEGGVGLHWSNIGDRKYTEVYRIKDGVITGNLNTTLGNTTYNNPSNINNPNNNTSNNNTSNNNTSNNNTSNNNSSGNSSEEYVEPIPSGSDLGLGPDDFQYYGLPIVEEIELNKPIIDKQYFLNKLSELIDYLIGFAILAIKMPLIGYTEIVEMVMSTGLDAIVGIDVSKYTGDGESAFEKIFSFMINSSRNVTIENIVYNRVPVLDVNVFNLVANKQYTGTGAGLKGNETYLANSYEIITKIKETIAIWYYTFRNLVIIIMLVVLIYIGLRMAISTVAEEKAKYKSMLIAWIVSFIIVFGIHYYMILIMQINESIINLVVPKDIIGSEISLYETVRSRAYELKASRAIVGTILYMLLVWYTLKFLLIYAKRLLSIIVLILVAPFASGTFALNKIKEGKTPIFDNWIKEYTINIIIQAIHAVLYTVFVQLALNLSGANIAGIILAFALIKFMTKADKIVRKIFKLRSGAKYSILDNNLEAAESLAGNISGLMAGGTIGKLYKNKWLKPMYGKSFRFAKDVLSIPFSGIKAGVVTSARNHLEAHPSSGTHPFREGIVNAIASSTLPHEREPILDKYGMPILGEDGKPLYKENKKWDPKGFFVFGKDGMLRYYQVPNTGRAVSSDIDKYIAQERARIRKNNKEAIKNFLAFGANTLKGAALMGVSIPFLIDNPLFGLNLFLSGYASIKPAYINRRKIKIKGFRKTIKTRRMTFKEFGQGLKDKMRYNLAHPVKTAGGVLGFITGANIYIKPMVNAKEILEDIGQKQEESAKQIRLLHEIRETEADAVEHATIIMHAIRQVSNTSQDVADDVQAELDVALLEYAKSVYGEEFYEALNKNVKVNAKNFRTKLQIKQFMQEYARSKHATRMSLFEQKLQRAIRTENPNNARNVEYSTEISRIDRNSDIVKKIKTSANPDRNIDFETEFEKKLNELKAQGRTKVNEKDLISITNDIIRENETKANLRSINPKLSIGRTANEKFEADIADTEKLKEELRNIYGDKLGSKFEYQIDSLVDMKKRNGTSTITEKEMQIIVDELLINEKTLSDAQFTEDDISGMKAQIDNFMRNNGSDIEFDDELEQRIKNKISLSRKTNAENQKVVSGKELRDILYEMIEENTPNEDAILSKEEVIDLVDMIKEKNTTKDVKFAKEFEENINKVMQEEIVRRTIDKHIESDPTKKTDENVLIKLEGDINRELERNGYDIKVDEVLKNKDITSSLEDSLEKNLEKQIDEIDTKSKNTEVKELTDMIMEAARGQDSIKRELKYNGQPLDYTIANEFAKDVEKLRALNYKAWNMGLKRSERNGKKLKEKEPVTDINDLVKNIWNSAKKS